VSDHQPGATSPITVDSFTVADLKEIRRATWGVPDLKWCTITTSVGRFTVYGDGDVYPADDYGRVVRGEDLWAAVRAKVDRPARSHEPRALPGATSPPTSHEPLPLCPACVATIGGACAGPDVPWRAARAHEPCGAADCAREPEPEPMTFGDKAP